MNYLVVGLNHKTAPIHIREKLAFDDDDSRKLLTQLKRSDILKESALISTCNRVEIVGVAESTQNALNQIFSIFQKEWELDQNYLYKKTDQDAIHHLFSVVSSLDSMILGENQIAKQVRDAYEFSIENQLTGPHLNRLFHKAFFVAKRVKSETEIAKGNVSVGSAGALLAKKIFGDLKDKKIVLFGAGEIGELVVKYLSQDTLPNHIQIINRTFQRAEDLANQGLGVAQPFEKLTDKIIDSHILVSSISKGYEFLNKAYFESIMEKRKNAPLFIIDLGVPRNIQNTVSEIDNLYLFNVDDLKEISEENKNSREQSFDVAKEIVNDESGDFFKLFCSDQAMPTIMGLGQKFEEIRKNEFTKSMNKLKHLGEFDQKNIEQMTKAIVSKILHDPIFTLKNTKDLSQPKMLNLIKQIFKLDDEE